MFPRLSNSLEIWQKLTGSQKTALGVAVLILVVVVVAVSMMASTPRYVQLYGNLTSEDAAAVLGKLKEQKVPYRLSNNGNSIEVPENQADETRLTLASEGLPRGGNVGFELFDKTQIGQSEFGEHLNFVRALQGELSRTIGLLQSVRAARVHLALPEQRLYSTEEKKASASVVLDLRNTSPSPREIKSIVHLVSAAVEGLEPNAVTVVDTSGNLLSDMLDTANDGSGSTRMQAQRTVAAQMEERVQSMLDRVLGPNKAVVRASVKLDFNQKQVDRETYQPYRETGKEGVLESQHQLTETYAGAKPGVAGGAVGVVPTAIPGTANGSSTASGGAYSRQDITTQYRVSKVIEHENVTPGQIQRINLALFVEQSVEKKVLESLRATVAAAVGIDAARGDIIEVTPIAFDTTVTKTAEAEAKQQARTAMLYTIGKYGGGGVLLVIFLLFLLSLYRSTLAPVTAQVMSGGQFALQGTHNPALPPSAAGAMRQYVANVMPSQDVPAVEDEINLENIDPNHVASVIKRLMAEE